MQHVMVVVPVDADIYEAQDVAEEHRQQRQRLVHAVAVWYLDLQHHDRDDDRDHGVAECLQPSLAHLPSVALPRRRREFRVARHSFTSSKQGSAARHTHSGIASSHMSSTIKRLSAPATATSSTSRLLKNAA